MPLSVRLMFVVSCLNPNFATVLSSLSPSYLVTAYLQVTDAISKLGEMSVSSLRASFKVKVQGGCVFAWKPIFGAC